MGKTFVRDGITLGLVLVFASGCSTIYGRQNDEQAIFFSANAPGVEVICSGKAIQTPGNIFLKQSKSHFCSATCEGYDKDTFWIRSGISKKGFQHSTRINTEKWGKWTLGVGTLLGWLVDGISGAMRGLKPDRFDLEMTPLGTTEGHAKVLEKTVGLSEALLTMPKGIADQTVGTVLDATVHSSAEQLGIATDEKRDDVEKIVEGKKEVKRLEEMYEDA